MQGIGMTEVATEIFNYYSELLPKQPRGLWKFMNRTGPIPRDMTYCSFLEDDAKGSYTHGKTTIESTIPPPPALLVLKTYLETHFNVKFRGAVINCYSPADHVGWHADNVNGEEKHPIFSISLGATRIFDLQSTNPEDSTSDQLRYFLSHGDLLVMLKGSQLISKHQVPKQGVPKKGIPKQGIPKRRVNITFRVVNDPTTDEQPTDFK